MNQLHDAAIRICAAGTISPNEVSNLRPLIWSQLELTDRELRELVSISEALASPCPEFTDFFAEAVVHFLLRQSDPKYYLKDQMVEWVEKRLAPEGQVDSYSKMEAMVRVLEQALNAPDRFKDWALAGIERSVLTGVGPTRMGGNISPGVVDSDDAHYLRRALFAAGGKGGTFVTAEEAELLFRIKDIVKDAMNAPEWERLFVQCTGNFVMAQAGRGMVSAKEAMRLERVMDDNRPHLGRFMRRMAEMQSLTHALGWALGADEEDWDQDRENARAATINAEETAWLKQQIAADGRTDAYEKALLTFLAEEAAGGLPASLQGLRKAG